MSLWFYDWGIGGRGVAREAQRLVPDLEYSYFSDSEFTPYGKLDRGDLAARVEWVLAHLASQGASQVVVACNAACTVLDVVRIPADLKLTNILATSWQIATTSPHTHIGVVGGEATISYLRSLAPPPTKTITLRAAQPLSALVEAGDLNSAKAKATVNEIFTPLATCEAIVLACTHYPAATELIRTVIPDIELLDPAKFLDWGFLAQRSI